VSRREDHVEVQEFERLGEWLANQAVAETGIDLVSQQVRVVGDIRGSDNPARPDGDQRRQ